jgi:hypothetical protein
VPAGHAGCIGRIVQVIGCGFKEAFYNMPAIYNNMAKHFALIFAAVFFLIFPPAQALQQDSLYLSMLNDSFRCIDIIIPDDLGMLENRTIGTKEYVLLTTAGWWADLTQQIVRTDENNTAIIPICFNTVGRASGECLDDFSINLFSDEVNKSKTWKGGICVSGFNDVDTGEGAPGKTAMQMLNDNNDMFSIGFKRPVVYAAPNELATFTILFESYAGIETEIRIDSFAQAEPRFITVKTNRTNPRREINITAFGTAAGEYSLNASAKVKYCTGSYCEKRIDGKLVTTNIVPEQSAGFTVKLFPENIDVKYLAPVLYELVIEGAVKTSVFDTELVISDGLETDFEKKSVTVSPGESLSMFFTVTPGSASAMYEIKAKARTGNTTKEAVSYLSTNELLTDAIREFETADIEQSNRSNLRGELNSFIDAYKNTEYGDELGAYSSYKAAVNASRTTIAQPQQTTAATQPVKPVEMPDMLIVVIVVIVVAIVAGAYFLLRMRKEEDMAVE